MTPATSSAPVKRSPDFFCIGAQKAGTTWLHQNLRRDERIWLPPVKELQYFNDLHIPGHKRWTQGHRNGHAGRRLTAYVRREDDPDLHYVRLLAHMTDPAISDDWYRRVFGWAPAGTLTADMTPEYSLLPDEGIAHLLRISPDAKIIFLMRDPIDRCWSHMRMLMKHGSQDADLAGISRLEDVYARADYPAILERWRRRVPDERMFVDVLDRIAADPADVLERLLAFLGLDFDPGKFRDLKKMVHRGDPLEIPGDIYDDMRDRLSPVYDAMAGEFPELTATWRAKHYG